MRYWWHLARAFLLLQLVWRSLAGAGHVSIPVSVLDEISMCARVKILGKSSKQHERLSLTPASFAVVGALKTPTTLSEFASALEGGSRDTLGVFRLAGNQTLRWVESSAMCAHLGRRFGQLVLVGDSVLRQLTNLIFALLRDNLQYGSLKDWLFPPRSDGNEPAFMCRCGLVFDCGIAPRFSRTSNPTDQVESYVNATANHKTERHYDLLHYYRDSYILRSTSDVDYYRTSMPVCAATSPHESVSVTQLWRPLPADLVNDAEMEALLEAHPRALVIFDTGMWTKHRKNESALYFSRLLSLRTRHPSITLLYHGQHFLPNRSSETQGFNDAMRELCSKNGVLHFDTDALTRGRATDCDPDCVHYGFDLNLLKAQALFNFLSLV